jgi:hypothetical protein
MKLPIASLLAMAALAPPGPRVLNGPITGSVYANADDVPMRMQPTDLECTKACVEEHEGRYVLYDGKQAYEVSDHHTAERCAGRKVRVTGTTVGKSKTIQVKSIGATK